METFFFTPPTRTDQGPHVRDGVDMKRVMLLVAIALMPCILMAMYNTGYQIHRVVEQGGALLDNWRTALYLATGLPVATASVLGCFVHGALYFVPVLLVTLTSGGDLRGDLRRRAAARDQRGLLRHRHADPADPAGHDPAVAGGRGHRVRRGDRQGDLRRHGDELPEPGAHRACVPVLRLSGAAFG